MKAAIIRILNYSICAWRVFRYRRQCVEFGRHNQFFGKVTWIGRGAKVGSHCTFNHGVVLNTLGGVEIGDYCRLSAYSQIHTLGLDIDGDYRNRPHELGQVVLEDGVWLAANAIVTAGNRIGQGSVIAAGAVVCRDVPAFELWGGVPARKLRALKRTAVTPHQAD